MANVYKVIDGFRLLTTTNNIAAHAGGGQASATQLTTEVNVVTTVANDSDSVKLFTPVAGLRVTVTNLDTTLFNGITIYPPNGTYLDDVLNGSIYLGAYLTANFSATDATHWYSGGP